MDILTLALGLYHISAKGSGIIVALKKEDFVGIRGDLWNKWKIYSQFPYYISPRVGIVISL